MAELGETSSPPSSSSNPAMEKPVVVRVKRKLSQARLDAFWLEINERPLKKPLLDLSNLSIENSNGKALEESRTKKVLVQHVETIDGSDAIKDVLLSFLPESGDPMNFRSKISEQKNMLKRDKEKQDQLRLVARLEHEDLARNARFEQIWKRRKGSIVMSDDSLKEICHLYDVVQIDAEELPRKAPKTEDFPIEDDAILCNYLPLLREFIPTAAEEIESDLGDRYNQESYVYDVYTAQHIENEDENDTSAQYPLVRVDDEDDYYDGGSQQSDYDTDDSNAEANPLHDYPDEESSEAGDQVEEELSGDSRESGSEYDEATTDVDEEDDTDFRWEYR